MIDFDSAINSTFIEVNILFNGKTSAMEDLIQEARTFRNLPNDTPMIVMETTKGNYYVVQGKIGIRQ